MAGPERHGSSVTRDLLEMEQLVERVRDAQRRHASVSVLRLGFRVSEDTTLARYLSLPIVPTFAGFDPRLQLLHEDDAAEAIVRAVIGEHPGVFNVAAAGRRPAEPGDRDHGRHARRRSCLHTAAGSARLALRALTGVRAPGHLADVIAFGSVMDCSRLAAEFGWSPATTTRAP